MRAGQLRHRVIVEENTQEETDEQPKWTAVDQQGVPCRVNDLAGQKEFRGRMVEAHTTTVVEMRWDRKLSNRRHRLRFGERLLNINRIIDTDGRKREAEVDCKEISDG